jgi:hypothetical protein
MFQEASTAAADVLALARFAPVRRVYSGSNCMARRKLRSHERRLPVSGVCESLCGEVPCLCDQEMPMYRPFKLAHSLALGLLLFSLGGVPVHAQELQWLTRSPGGDGVPVVDINCGQWFDSRRNTAVDADGNLYMAGCSMGEILTMKVTPSGEVAWVHRSTFPNQQSVYALSVDGAGNVYIAAWQRLLKLSPLGTLEWTRPLPWSSVHSLSSQLAGVVVAGWDQSTIRLASYDEFGLEVWNTDLSTLGLVDIGHVATLSNGDLALNGRTETELLTARFSADGNLMWSRTKSADFPGGALNSPLSTSSDGSVYSGVYLGTAGSTTVKYDPAGNELWTASGPAECETAASAATIDGGVVITGTNVAREFVTIKYAADGTQQWLRRFGIEWPRQGRAAALSIDEQGDIYVSGTTADGGIGRLASVKYSLSGAQIWASVENSPEFEESDGLTAAYVPSAGLRVWGQRFDPYRRFLAVGYAGGTGARQWRVTNPVETGVFWEGMASEQSMAVTADGRAYLIGYTTNDFRPRARMLAIEQDGQRAWSRNILEEQIANQGSPNAVAVDTAGNAYVVGAFVDENFDTQHSLMKFDSQGQLLWRSPVTAEAPRLLALDDEVYVAGAGFSLELGNLLVLEKFDAAGASQWSVTHEGSPNGTDRIGEIAVDSQGNLIAVYGGDFSSETGFGVLKYSATGSLLWSTESPDFSNSGKAFLRIGANDDIFVASTAFEVDVGLDYATHKYTTDGMLVWTHRYHRSAAFPTDPDTVGAMALHPAGGVIVSGQSPAGYATIRLDENGALQWERLLNGEGSSPPLLDVDPAGNSVLVTLPPQSPGPEFLVLEYGIDGQEVWRRSFDSESLGGSLVSSVRKLADGSILLGTTLRVPDMSRDSMALLRIRGGALFQSDFEQVFP